MAEALAVVDAPVIHVVSLPGNTAHIPGQCDIADEDIAKWCAATAHVLVTCDTDFRTRWVKSGLLARHGAEVIVFDKDLEGLEEQHGRVTAHLPYWRDALEQHPYGFRVWRQGRERSPRLHVGKK